VSARLLLSVCDDTLDGSVSTMLLLLSAPDVSKTTRFKRCL